MNTLYMNLILNWQLIMVFKWCFFNGNKKSRTLQHWMNRYNKIQNAHHQNVYLTFPFHFSFFYQCWFNDETPETTPQNKRLFLTALWRHLGKCTLSQLLCFKLRSTSFLSKLGFFFQKKLGKWTLKHILLVHFIFQFNDLIIFY